MAKAKINAGDEVLVRATVKRVWEDGKVTVQFLGATAAPIVTLLNDSYIEQPAAGKGERLV